jgi:hypothetical protein
MSQLFEYVSFDIDVVCLIMMIHEKSIIVFGRSRAQQMPSILYTGFNIGVYLFLIFEKGVIREKGRIFF